MDTQTKDLTASKSAARNHDNQRKAGKLTKGATGSKPPKQKTTRRDQLAAMLLRKKGASIEQITGAFGWKPHTARAAISGLRKRGYEIESALQGGKRIYKATKPKTVT